jgi:hypothetical protein
MGYEDTSDEALLALARLGAGMNVDTRGEAERLRACECFEHFCEMKGLQQVLVVLLGSGGDWCEGEPVGVGQ